MATTTASPVLQALISDVRDLLNQPDPNNSFWTDRELTKYINEGIRTYFSELVQLNEGYYIKSVPRDITSGQEEVTMPADFFAVRSLYKKINDGYVMLSYQNNLTSGFSSIAGNGSLTYFPSYYFRNNKIVLRDPPTFSETSGLLLEYIYLPDSLINGGDALDSNVSPVFKQVIEMYAVYKAKMKESLVNGVRVHDVAAENFTALHQQFKETIKNRSKNPTYVIPFDPEGS